MKKIHDLIFLRQLGRRSIRSLIFSFTLVAVIVTNWGFSAKVMAQNAKFTDEEVISYAKALLVMEPVRQQAFEDIKKAINGREVPKILCSEPNSINNLPNEARKIAVRYCNRSQEIVAANGLTIEKFNQITLEVQSNNKFKDKVYEIMKQLQKKSSLSRILAVT